MPVFDSPVMECSPRRILDSQFLPIPTGQITIAIQQIRIKIGKQQRPMLSQFPGLGQITIQIRKTR